MGLDQKKRLENDGHETAETTDTLLNAPCRKEGKGVGKRHKSEFFVPWLDTDGEMQMIRSYLC